MKRILTLMLVVVLAFAMISCDSNTDNSVNAATNNQVNEATNEVTNEETNEATTEATNEATTEESNETTKENTETTEDTTEATETTEEAETTEATETTEEADAQPEYEFVPIDVTQLDDANRPVVTITLSDDQEIVLKMVPEVAPNTINSFITLANEGYYDGLTFHRIIKDFMIQGGDPEGTGAGGPGYTIKDEFYVIDELKVTYLSHTRGIISMAKTQAPNSAGSQFFITHGDSAFLDGAYSSFGFVVEGMDVVDALATVETGENDLPVEAVVIKTISVELNGYELSAPETISVQ